MQDVLVLVSLPPGMPFGDRRLIMIEADRVGFSASADLSRDELGQALGTASRLIQRMKRINGRRPIEPLPSPASAGADPISAPAAVDEVAAR